MKLARITLHPVKSLAGRDVLSARLESRGLAHDRRWMVVDATGRFITQRSHPQMVHITAEPALTGLRLTTAGHPDCTVDRLEGTAREVVVWRDTVQAEAPSPEADAWLSQVLGTPCQLVHLPEQTTRPIDPDFGKAGDETSFADGFPLLILGTASLADIDARMPGHGDAARFRANLLIEGALPWAEDHWLRLRIGEVELELVKPCSRCTVVNVDPQTGTPDPDGQPLRALREWRRNAQGNVIVGQNAVPRKIGTLRVGDAVEVLSFSPSEDATQ